MMRDKKLILRVLSKLLALFAGLMVVYVFMSGLSGEQGSDDNIREIVIDVSGLEPGEVRHMAIQGRKILILNQWTGRFLVVDARDPVFGCPVEWRQQQFVSSCNGSTFNSRGKVNPGQMSDEDLHVLTFELSTEKQLKIYLE